MFEGDWVNFGKDVTTGSIKAGTSKPVPDDTLVACYYRDPASGKKGIEIGRVDRTRAENAGWLPHDYRVGFLTSMGLSAASKVNVDPVHLPLQEAFSVLAVLPEFSHVTKWDDTTKTLSAMKS